MDEVRFPITVNFPSGGVDQVFNPFSYTQTGGQFGLINVSLGTSTAAAVEHDMLTTVGSYGKQIGRIAEALDALISALDRKGVLGETGTLGALDAEEKKAIGDLRELMCVMRHVKKGHGRL